MIRRLIAPFMAAFDAGTGTDHFRSACAITTDVHDVA